MSILSKLLNGSGEQTEQRLNELTAQVTALNRVLAVIEFSPQGIILDANDNFLNAVGYTKQEVVGQHHKIFMPEEEINSNAYREFWSELAAGRFQAGQFKRINKQKKDLWLEASYNPMFDQNNRVYKVIKYATDITAAKIKEMDYAGQISAINKLQAVIEFDLLGNILNVNDIFAAATGYTKADIIGQHHSMFVDAGYKKSEEYRQFWQKLSNGIADAGRYKRFGRGGKEVWLQASYNPIFDINGKPYKVVKYASDITEQVAIEEQAKTLSLVANETDNSVVITDANGMIEYVNQGFTRLTGYSFAEAIGKKPGALLQGKYTDPQTKKRIREKLDSKKPFYEEILNYNKSGESYWISLAINPVFDAKGNLEKFVSIQTNINQTKLNTLEFLAKLEAISKVNGIIEFTADGMVTDANDNFCKVVGYSLAEMKGKPHDMFVESSYRSSAEYKTFWNALNRNEPQVGQFKRIGKAGNEIWLEASYNPIVDEEGKVIKVVKFATDITAQTQAARALEQAVAESQQVIEDAKAGNLVGRVPLDGKSGAIGSLCSGINALLDNMTEVLLSIREAGETINTAAGEISSGNNDLSSRTEQQASSLEETASSMEELSSTVKQNAENAKQANQLAAAASSVAIKGGQVVGEVVNTMSAINESAHKIEDIIAVIDGIAFQTNILALNAAVEAARAGEQGRGFAVVAGEVRNLAQRSASAAKEIKELITDSVNKTAEGTSLVENAGRTMDEIVSSVQRVTDIMSEISAASIEQSSGIEQVNEAIGSMDEVTQQNAALVEEAAAAAESLVDQAQTLMNTVSAFRLNNTVGSSFNQQAGRMSASPMRNTKSSTARSGPVSNAATHAKAPLKTGTDDEWETF